MTKEEAQAEVVRRWRELPDDLRLSYSACDAFALRLADELEFTCYTDKDQLIAAWMIREINLEKKAATRAA